LFDDRVGNLFSVDYGTKMFSGQRFRLDQETYIQWWGTVADYTAKFKRYLEDRRNALKKIWGGCRHGAPELQSLCFGPEN